MRVFPPPETFYRGEFLVPISVIVPTIARPSLKITLESIAKQTFKDFDIVITDDTDDGKARMIIDEFQKSYPNIKIKYEINKKYPKGPGGNRNNGLDLADGEYITFVDDDDELMSYALEVACSYIKKHNLDVFLANCNNNSTGEKTGMSYGISSYLKYEDFIGGVYEGEYFVVVKKSLIGENRFPADAWGAEFVLWFDVFKKAQKIYYSDEVLKVYSVEGERVTKQQEKYPSRQSLNYYYIIENFYQDFKVMAPKQLLRYVLQGIYFSKLSNNFNRAVWFLKKIWDANLYYGTLALIFLSVTWCLPNVVLSFLKNCFSPFIPLIKKVLRK